MISTTAKDVTSLFTIVAHQEFWLHQISLGICGHNAVLEKSFKKFCYLSDGHSSLCVGLGEQGMNESSTSLSSFDPHIRNGPPAPAILVLASNPVFFFFCKQGWHWNVGEIMLG